MNLKQYKPFIIAVIITLGILFLTSAIQALVQYFQLEQIVQFIFAGVGALFLLFLVYSFIKR